MYTPICSAYQKIFHHCRSKDGDQHQLLLRAQCRLAEFALRVEALDSYSNHFVCFLGLNLRQNGDSKEDTKDEPYEHVDKSKRDPKFIRGKLKHGC